MVWLGWYSC